MIERSEKKVPDKSWWEKMVSANIIVFRFSLGSNSWWRETRKDCVTEIGVQLCKAWLILNVETQSTIYGNTTRE